MPVLGNLDTYAPICALSWLRDPDVLLVLIFLVVLREGLVVGVIEAFLNMEGDWQTVKGIFTNSLIVIFHIHEQGLLVT